LMKAARIPLDRLLQKKQTLEWKQEAYREINESLISFRTNQALKMKLQGTFQVKKATSSDASVVTATPGSSASPGTYTIEVTQLAKVANNISSAALSANPSDKIDPTATLESQKSKFASAWGATTTLQFSITTHPGGGGAVTKTFTVDTTTDSLNHVLADINAETSLGVTAFYEASTDKVVISTTGTGDYSTNEIEITDITDTFALGTLHLSATAQGQNAVVSINGLTGITKYENSFTLNNVTFNLLKQTSGTPVTVTVASDTDTVVNTVKSFVADFNSLLKTINDKLNEKRYPDYLPLTDEQKKELTDKQIEQWEEKAKSGLLNNDSILQNAVYELRRAITTQVSGLTAYDSIYDLGITTGFYFEGGTLYVDETKLREAVSNNPDAVMQLFTRYDASYTYEQKGLGVRLYDTLNDFIDRLTDEAGYPSNFSLYDDSYIADIIKDLDERISETEDRLKTLEDRYWRQFTAMEQAIALFNTQSAWLTRQTSGG
ncbi:MAG: flagellar filament capping protein FliD, partial [Firmicutes bacterium]|nr:flagellar filament capping protein FliD [Bacillota bacterium]